MVSYQKIAGSTADHDISLAVFGAEVLARYLAKAKLLDATKSLPLPAGADSVAFPAFGKFGVDYYAAGTDLFANVDTANQNQLYVYADRPLISHTFIDKLQEMLEAAPLRQSYAANMAKELAEKTDENIARLVFKGAAQSAVYTGGPTGLNATCAATTLAGVTAEMLTTWITNSATAFDENNVDEDRRFVALRPAQYRALLDAGVATFVPEAVSSDYGDGGNLALGVLPMFQGFHLISTNNVPITSGDGTSNQLDANKGNDYNIHMTGCAGIAFHSEAVGSVRISDIVTKAPWVDQYDAFYLQAKSLIGHGVLRPEACSRLSWAI